MSILSPAWPLVFWLYSAYYVHQNSQTVSEHPLLFIFAWGIVMSKLTNRLVVSSKLDYFSTNSISFW